MKERSLVTNWKLEITNLDEITKMLSEIEVRQENIKKEFREIKRLADEIDTVRIQLKKAG